MIGFVYTILIDDYIAPTKRPLSNHCIKQSVMGLPILSVDGGACLIIPPLGQLGLGQLGEGYLSHTHTANNTEISSVSHAHMTQSANFASNTA